MNQPADKAGEDVVEAINTAWDKLYGGEPVSDPKALCNRIRAIAGDVECGRVNFRVTNAAYVKADKELRELRCALSSGEPQVSAVPMPGEHDVSMTLERYYEFLGYEAECLLRQSDDPSSTGANP